MGPTWNFQNSTLIRLWCQKSRVLLRRTVHLHANKTANFLRKTSRWIGFNWPEVLYITKNVKYKNAAFLEGALHKKTSKYEQYVVAEQVSRMSFMSASSLWLTRLRVGSGSPTTDFTPSKMLLTRHASIVTGKLGIKAIDKMNYWKIHKTHNVGEYSTCASAHSINASLACAVHFF